MAAELIGRDGELSSLTAFVEAIESGSSAFVVEGEAGIGKTTVWQAGVRAAESRAAGCFRAGRPAPRRGSRSRRSAISWSPCSRRCCRGFRRCSGVHSSRRSFSRRQATIRPGSARSRSAFLGVVRSLAETGAVVVAVDDVQWLDGPTAGVLEFAARRLREEPVGLLIARRSTGGEPAPLGLDRHLPEERLRRIRLGPLSLGELPGCCSGVSGSISRGPALRRLRAASGGNSFFALEIGRALVRSGGDLLQIETLPVPETLRELVRNRLAPLPARTREALLAASALSRADAPPSSRRHFPAAPKRHRPSRARVARRRRVEARTDPLHASAAGLDALRRRRARAAAAVAPAPRDRRRRPGGEGAASRAGRGRPRRRRRVGARPCRRGSACAWRIRGRGPPLDRAGPAADPARAASRAVGDER